ncbi:MAG: hypothetical protein ACE5FV_12910 [Woeseia sp.]
MTELNKLLAEHLGNAESSWSMGTYGAVAEFFQAPGEAVDSAGSNDLVCVTPRGGISLEPRDDVRAFTIAKNGQQHTAFCLSAEGARMSCASVLTECGVDELALREQDRDAVLFDLGVSALGSGCFQLDFCVRTADTALADFCRAHCGASVFEKDSPVLPRLLEAQPHRVVITRLGRIEVYQSIGGEDTDGKTPEGPHTHLLPELLRLNRTHAVDMPVDDGWVPCAFLYRPI